MPRIPRVTVLRRRLHAISRMLLHGKGGSNNKYNTSSLYDIKLTTDSSGNSSSIGMVPRSTIATASTYPSATILRSGNGTTNISKISSNILSAHQYRQLGKDEFIYEPGTRQNEGTQRHSQTELQSAFLILIVQLHVPWPLRHTDLRILRTCELKPCPPAELCSAVHVPGA